MDKPDTHFHSNAPFSPSAVDEMFPPREGPRFYRVSASVQATAPPLFPLVPSSCRIITSRCGPLRRNVHNVVEGRKDHQHYNDGEADPKAIFLGAVRQRATANSLDRIEQKVSAVEQRHRE